MSYVPPVTFAPGTTILASGVQANLDAMQEYNNGGVIAADLRTSAPWVAQQHMVRPTYDGVRRVWEGVSGISAASGRAEVVGRYTYAMRATSSPSSTSAVWQFVPGTAKLLIVPRSLRTLHLQYSFSGKTASDSTVAAAGAAFGSPVTKVRAFMATGKVRDVADLVGLGSLSLFQEHQLQIEDDQDVGDGRLRRGHQSGFKLLTNVAAGVYTVGLAAQSTCPKTRVWRWSVCAEGWMV